MKVVVIIPAAGLGTRMVSPPSGKARKPVSSKQFMELDGTPVLVHTLRRFSNSPEINEIFVALRKAEIEPFRARLEKDAPELLQKNPTFIKACEHPHHSFPTPFA